MLHHALLIVLSFGLARAADTPAEREAKAFLATYEKLYQAVYTVAQKQAWLASTDVSPAHDEGRVAGNKALAALTGDGYVIETARRLRAHDSELSPLTRKQLERVWLYAAENPGTLPEASAERVEAESRQSSTMDSFPFCLERQGGKCVRPTTPNEIDDVLVSSRDLAVRLKYWNAAKESGPALKPGLIELRDLRNQVARAFEYPSYFDLQVAWYEMSTPEMMKMLEDTLKDIQPLYRQLHCWTKYELAKRYGEPVPKRIPAHWLGNRWAQEWPGLVEGVDLDPLFKTRTPEWIAKQAEAFYVSLGLGALPENFWRNSDLYPVDPKARRKNTHATAWHIDLDHEVRSLQSIEPNAYWWGTAHHEFGHIYYFLSYARPEVPILLRDGANRAFHEGFGDMIAIAASQQPYLRDVGVLPSTATIDQTRWLLNEALGETITFLPFSAGTMSHWERDLYAGNLPPSEWNARWWQYVRQFQGVDPPETRGEDLCDACTKTHINDNPAYYYTYAVGTVFKYQVHDHICRTILHQDPRSCDYRGHKEVGDFLKGLLSVGATRDWRQLMRETTGADLSSKPMLDYFSPLMSYLKEQNKGRSCSWE
ncbi:MAG: M2 family metallopeptidase [Elusimicrobia bacterium]|nr:M2 family metallopeptidase [Elusimicrobiota bacterium]